MLAPFFLLFRTGKSVPVQKVISYIDLSDIYLGLNAEKCFLQFFNKFFVEGVQCASSNDGLMFSALYNPHLMAFEKITSRMLVTFHPRYAY
jgi:hypothetical protein